MPWASYPWTLRQLQYVAAIAETRSFRRAAALCAVSQPSLSAQVAQVESVLGLRLFERSKRQVLLTRAGEELLLCARRILREADELAESATRLADPLAGTLRVGVIPTISPYLVPEIAPVLRARYPRLRLLWIEDKTAVLAAKLRSGELDAALVALEADLGDVEHVVLGHDPFVLATPLGHPLGVATTPVRLRDLRGAPVLLLDDGHCFRDQALTFCERAQVEELDYRATSLGTLTQMVASGAGITLLPQLALATELPRGALRTRTFAKPVPGRTISLVWRRGTARTPTLRTVAGSMVNVYKRVVHATKHELSQ